MLALVFNNHWLCYTVHHTILTGEKVATKFITNNEKLLKNIINHYIPSSENLKFLVGYFFFSGFTQIYKEIGDKPLKILVGMDADVDVHNCIREFSVLESDNQKSKMLSKQSIINNFNDSIVNIINKADALDTAENENTFRFFIKKLKKGTLEVRKTKDPNHAKMYLFESNTNNPLDIDYGTVIIGSSNLSFQGVQGRSEINVCLKDDHDFEDGKEIFDILWDSAIPLVDKSNKDEFLKDVITRTWLETVPSPYLLYVRVLYEYFKINNDYIKTPKELTKDSLTEFFDVSYQTDAIKEGVTKLKKHSGCIIADVVGLGKSIIASAIAANMNLKTVIIAPPHLEQQWQDYAYDFGLRSPRTYSSGKLEQALAENKKAGEILIIIDESHRYRNENTESYGFLHQLCAGNKVLLLSATPFNNRPDDIFSLIKLFQIPSRSTIQTVNDLGAEMATLVKTYKELKKNQRNKIISNDEFKKQANGLADEIRSILEPVMIRRTRLDLENLVRYRDDLAQQNISFSTVNPPIEQNYELGSLTGLYIKTLEQISGKLEDGSGQVFIGTRYMPLMYLRQDEKIIKKYREIFENDNFMAGQKNMAFFMRQLIVRRFESSIYSFTKTLANILRSMENTKKWFDTYKKIPLFKKGALPDFDNVEDTVDEMISPLFDDIDEILKLMFSPQIAKGLILIEADELLPQFITDLEADIELFKSFLNEWSEQTDDPKLNSIATKIQDSIKNDAKRKIIIFSEFADTTDYLYEKLKANKLRVIKYSSAVATRTKRDEIRRNFDAGYPESMQRNDYDVLIATDAISEGFSLHRAGTIYNYDIPYNPTRVIQRVGRINRINKKVFETLYIYNFFPSATGEKVSHTKEISTFKMILFQAILGSDTKILTEDEITEGYFSKAYQEAENENNAPSWYVEYQNELYRIEREERDVLEQAKALPQRCRTAKPANSLVLKSHMEETKDLFQDDTYKGVILFSKKADAFRFTFSQEDGKAGILPAQIALQLFKSEETEKSNAVTKGFYPLYQRAKEMSGIIKVPPQRGKNIQEATSRVRILLKKVDDEKSSDYHYLESLLEIINLDCLPVYYLRYLAKIKPTRLNTILEIREIVSESYIESLLEKESKIDSEPETILLAEEFI